MAARRPSPTSNGWAPAALSVLEQRVQFSEKSVTELSLEIGRVEQSTAALINRVEASLSAQNAALTAKFDERGRVPWQAIGVMLAFITVVGGLVYFPIRESQTRIEMQLADVPNNREIEGRVRFSEQRFNSIADTVTRLQGAQVPRVEHDRQWAHYEVRHTELQRQIDELKKGAEGLYSARDVLKDQQDRLRALEAQLQTLRRVQQP